MKVSGAMGTCCLHGHKVSLQPQCSCAVPLCHVGRGPGLCKSAAGTTAAIREDIESSEHTRELSISSKHPYRALDILGRRDTRMCNMTFEESGGENSSDR